MFRSSNKQLTCSINIKLLLKATNQKHNFVALACFKARGDNFSRLGGSLFKARVGLIFCKAPI